MDFLPVRRALLSVTDKGGLVEFARFLAGHGVDLVSTGGTLGALEAAGLAVTPVSRVTGFPEILNGRVKTLHPHIHAGILANKDNPGHLATLRELGIQPFDLICVNLYNFAAAAAKSLCLTEIVEEIDIGGPCMLRAAAKNFHSVLVASDPARYPEIMQALEAQARKGVLHASLELRRLGAAAAFAATAAYDVMIADYLKSADGLCLSMEFPERTA